MARIGSTQFIQFAIQWSSIALLYYDYLLTFGMEVKYVWGQKFRFSTILYVFCRYGLVANVVYIFTIANMIHASCDTGYKVAGALSVLGRFAVIVVWSARTYAVFGKSRIILAYFASLGLACIILDIMHVPILQCRGGSSDPFIGGLLSILTVILEITSAMLTTFRAIQTLNVGGSWKSQRKGFMYLLLEQGILYFCVVTGFTIVSLVLNVRIPGGFLQRLLNALTLPLSGLMTARFLLHLRRWEAKHAAFGTTGADQVPQDGTRMEFTSNPNHRSTIQTAISQISNDFGEDPVRRAQMHQHDPEVSLGTIPENSMA